MCCQLPGKISRPPLTKRKNGKEQGSSGRPGCAGSGASAGSRKKVPAVRKIHRQEPGFGQHAGTLPAPPEMPPVRGSRSAHRGLTGSRAERHRAGHGRKKDSTGSRGAGVYPAGSGKTQRQPFNSRKLLWAAFCGTAAGQAKSKEACGAWRMTGYSVRRGTWPRFCGLW